MKRLAYYFSILLIIVSFSVPMWGNGGVASAEIIRADATFHPTYASGTLPPPNPLGHYKDSNGKEYVGKYDPFGVYKDEAGKGAIGDVSKKTGGAYDQFNTAYSAGLSNYTELQNKYNNQSAQANNQLLSQDQRDKIVAQLQQTSTQLQQAAENMNALRTERDNINDNNYDSARLQQVVQDAQGQAKNLNDIETQTAAAYGYTGDNARADFANNSTQQAKDAQTAAGKQCSFFNGSSAVVNCAQNIVAWILYMCLTAASWFVGIAGLLLNNIMEITIVEMATRINTLGAINYGWGLIRDLCNMTFIFILLYIAIRTILGLANTDTKRLIRNLIIVALLINFSLFFTKVLVDASNIVSLEFYNRFTKSSSTGDKSTGEGKTNVNTITDMSDKMMEYLGLKSLYGGEQSTQDILVGKDWGGMIIFGIGGSVLMVVVGISFLYAAILFILRFIIILFLLLLSPLGYFGYILPATTDWAKKWWNTLIAQLTFAPLYMILILLVFLLAEGIFKPEGTNSTAAAVAGADLKSSLTQNGPTAAGAMGPLFNFVLLIGLINGAGILATSVAAGSGGFVGKAFNKAQSLTSKATRRVAGAAAFGGVGLAGRLTRGRSNYKKLESEREGLKTRIAAGDKTAEARLKQLEANASRSYDFRNTKLGASLGLGKGGGVGGVKARRDRRAEKTNAKIGKAGEISTATREAMEAAQTGLTTAEAAHAAAISMPATTDAERAARTAAITAAERGTKEAQANVDRHKRAAIREIRDGQARVAARVAGSRWSSKASKDAANTFLAGYRNTKRTDEEKADETADKITANIGNPAELTNIISRIKPANAKDIPGRVLQQGAVLDEVWAQHGTRGAMGILKNISKYTDREADNIVNHITDPARLQSFSVGDFIELQKSDVLANLSPANRAIFSGYMQAFNTPVAAAAPAGSRDRALYEYLNNRGNGYWR